MTFYVNTLGKVWGNVHFGTLQTHDGTTQMRWVTDEVELLSAPWSRILGLCAPRCYKVPKSF